MIKNSLEWSPIENKLKHKSRELKFENEIKKMIDNVQLEVTELSKAEIKVRRGAIHAADEILLKINQDIEMIEEYILVATLLG